MSEEEILSSVVLKDEQRLAHDGYAYDVVEGDGTISVDVYIKQGQHRRERWSSFVAMPLNDESQIRMEQMLMVVDAMTAFLNTGGDPHDLLMLGSQFGQLHQLHRMGFELLGVVEDPNRQYYYGKSDGRVYRVYPGLLSEEVSEAEVRRMVEEEDGEITIPQTFAQAYEGSHGSENSLGWPGDDEA